MESVLEAVFRIKVNSDKALSYDDAIKQLRENLRIILNGPLTKSIALVDLNTLKFADPIQERDHVIILHDEDEDEEYDDDNDDDEEEEDEDDTEFNFNDKVIVTKEENNQIVEYIGVFVGVQFNGYDKVCLVKFEDDQIVGFPFDEVRPYEEDNWHHYN